MTNVYILRPELERHPSFELDHEGRERRALLLLGEDPVDEDRPFAVTEDWPPRASASDYPGFGNVPCFSERAAVVLDPLLAGRGRWYPVLAPSGPFRAFQVTDVLAALDGERSGLVRYPWDGRIAEVERHWFREEVVRSATIFKLARIRASRVYVTQPFVDAASRAVLEGMEFACVWDGIDDPWARARAIPPEGGG